MRTDLSKEVGIPPATSRISRATSGRRATPKGSSNSDFIHELRKLDASQIVSFLSQPGNTQTLVSLIGEAGVTGAALAALLKPDTIHVQQPPEFDLFDEPTSVPAIRQLKQQLVDLEQTGNSGVLEAAVNKLTTELCAYRDQCMSTYDSIHKLPPGRGGRQRHVQAAV